MLFSTKSCNVVQMQCSCPGMLLVHIGEMIHSVVLPSICFGLLPFSGFLVEEIESLKFQVVGCKDCHTFWTQQRPCFKKQGHAVFLSYAGQGTSA